jgi:aspartoacylase
MIQAIKQVLIAGGTHGNELSGVHAVQNWLENPALITASAPSVKIELTLVNQKAIGQCRRYIDEDLNRQFTHGNLQAGSTHNSPHEVQLAQILNGQFGPKGASKTDFVIDIHNTTSNMGPTLIVIENDDFHKQLARYVKQCMPEAIILVEDFKPFADFGYFCTLGKRGVMVEVGPQAQGGLKAIAYQQAVSMTSAILAFIDLYNQGNVPQLAPVEAFRLGTEVNYPTYDGKKVAMIHPLLDGQDFQLLRNGAPCFVDFDGNSIAWDGQDTYPHFIGEVAYHHLHIAFATSSKIEW